MQLFASEAEKLAELTQQIEEMRQRISGPENLEMQMTEALVAGLAKGALVAVLFVAIATFFIFWPPQRRSKTE